MSVTQNLQSIKEKIKTLNPQVNLIAVSKTIGEEQIREAIDCGCEIFGENRVSEAKAKWVTLKNQYKNVKLHLIGHLQSNKAKDAVEIFDVIQSLDSEKLAIILAKEMAKKNKEPNNGQNKFPEIFVQINIGEEEQKSGINPKDAKDFIRKMIDEYNLPITGVMAIGPLGEDPTLYFSLLNKIAKQNNLKNISMGMSEDFETAILMGANFVRIGSAIFGERTK